MKSLIRFQGVRILVTEFSRVYAKNLDKHSWPLKILRKSCCSINHMLVNGFSVIIIINPSLIISYIIQNVAQDAGTIQFVEHNKFRCRSHLSKIFFPNTVEEFMFFNVGQDLAKYEILLQNCRLLHQTVDWIKQNECWVVHKTNGTEHRIERKASDAFFSQEFQLLRRSHIKPFIWTYMNLDGASVKTIQFLEKFWLCA